MAQMKTYSPADWSMTMSEDIDGEWVFLEDHLAVVAENALQIKRREVEIERLKASIEQLKFDLACKKYSAEKWKTRYNDFKEHGR